MTLFLYPPNFSVATPDEGKKKEPEKSKPEPEKIKAKPDKEEKKSKPEKTKTILKRVKGESKENKVKLPKKRSSLPNGVVTKDNGNHDDGNHGDSPLTTSFTLNPEAREFTPSLSPSLSLSPPLNINATPFVPKSGGTTPTKEGSPAVNGTNHEKNSIVLENTSTITSTITGGSTGLSCCSFQFHTRCKHHSI